MTNTDNLRTRNGEFLETRFPGELPLAPALRTVIVACADQRADPTHVLGLRLGEAAVVRNAGGRITPATLQAIAMMATVIAEEGESGGFEMIVMHHTDCGVSRLARHEDLLATYFGVPADELPAKHVTDPFAAVRADIATLRDNPFLPDDLIVSGLVYDVKTGAVSTAVEAAALRSGVQ
jgi:carbonic anhydrase